MKLRAVIPVLMLLFLRTSQAQDSLTVDQAVDRVLSVHPSVLGSLHRVDASTARWHQSMSTQRPEFSGEALYTRIGPVPELSFPGLGNFLLFPENNYDGHFGGMFTVYDFGRAGASVDLNESHVQSARDAVELTKTSLTFQTIRTFYAILMLEQSIGVQQEQIDALNQHIGITKKKLSSGSATNFDLLTTQVRVATAEQQKVDLENALQKQQATMRQLLGIPSGSQLLLHGDFQIPHRSLSPDSLVELALLRRPEISAAEDEILSAEIQTRLASRGSLPSLKINANYGVKNGYIPNLGIWRGNWVAGAILQIPIYDGGRTSGQEEEAEAMLLAAQEHKREIELQIRAEVEQAVADLKAADDKLAIAELQVRQAEAAVQLARTKYETGSMTNLDLLDSEAAESAARLGHLQALYKYKLGHYELLRVTGEPAM